MLWLLKGGYEAPGWRDLETDAKAGTTDVVHFDRLAWALVNADEPPRVYDGLEPTEPPDGLYIDPNGVPLYLVDRKIVGSAEEVLDALGDEARKLAKELGDADAALQRLGRAY